MAEDESGDVIDESEEDEPEGSLAEEDSGLNLDDQPAEDESGDESEAIDDQQSEEEDSQTSSLAEDESQEVWSPKPDGKTKSFAKKRVKYAIGSLKGMKGGKGSQYACPGGWMA